MEMSIENFDLKYDRYMEKLNENAYNINMCINGQCIPNNTKLFIPFCNKDDELITGDEFLKIYDKPCNHRLELNTTNITINNGCIGIYDTRTFETFYISISPRDISQIYSLLNNTFNNNLLLVNMVKNIDSPEYTYVDGEYAISGDRMCKLLKLTKSTSDAKIQAPCAISSSIVSTLLHLNDVIIKYVINAIVDK